MVQTKRYALGTFRKAASSSSYVLILFKVKAASRNVTKDVHPSNRLCLVM